MAELPDRMDTGEPDRESADDVVLGRLELKQIPVRLHIKTSTRSGGGRPRAGSATRRVSAGSSAPTRTTPDLPGERNDVNILIPGSDLACYYGLQW